MVRYSPGRHNPRYVLWSCVGAGVPWRHCEGWHPPTDPEPTPAKPALAVGQLWRRRDGEVVTVDFTSGDCFSAGEWWYDPNGTAPFPVTGPKPQYDLIELLPTPTPRKFASLTRTIDDLGHIIDAIDEDGVAWWMTPATDDPEPEWQQLTPLPGREVAG